MKYIRTKDGIAKVKNEWEYVVGGINIDDVFFADSEILKQADTIEELCDQFVYVTNNGNHYVKNNHEAIHYFIGEERPVSYYGAIWTDKGLIYVAKMNDKGELELL